MFNYLDYPQIPEELLLSKISDFDHLDNIFQLPNYPFYKQYLITNDGLMDFLKSIFPFNFYATYQIIRNGIAIHKDFDRTETLNYLIDAGGPDATLTLFDDNKQPIHSEVIEIKRWHRIDVTVNHNVSNFSSHRIAISVVPLETI